MPILQFGLEIIQLLLNYIAPNLKMRRFQLKIWLFDVYAKLYVGNYKINLNFSKIQSAILSVDISVSL